MNTPASTQSSSDILVVDDDPRNRRLLEGYLTSEGYAVRSAADGSTALAMAGERVPDVVLLDVMMPGIDGLEVCRRLKADPRTRLSQVVLVTALDGTSHRVKGLDCGADDYLTKPVRREEFLAKIRSAARARRLVLELEQAREILARRNAQLEELEALKETLAQTLVHDLKNPLAVFVGHLDLIARKGDPDTLRMVGRCRASADRMHRMILDLLDVAGLEEGRLKLAPEPLDCASVAQAAVEAAEVIASPRRVGIEVHLPDADCTVGGDPSVLRRVVDNLIANAVEHSPPESTVRVEVRRREEGVEIRIADQGSGIPPEHRERVFEKYARLELKKAGVAANRGLGLTFCRLAVEAHGGTIWADDAPDGGALFRVLLPALESEASSPAPEAEVA